MQNKFLLFVAVCFFSSVTHGALIYRGNGMVYDDILDVTWLQNANTAGQAMTWSNAKAFVNNLDFGGFNDWRLPSLSAALGATNDLKVTCGAGRFDQATTGCDVGWNSNSPSHELAYMFYQNLGNVAAFDTNGAGTGQFGPQLTGFTGQNGLSRMFTGIQSSLYWYDTEFDADSAFFFATSTGGQFFIDKTASAYVWALRDGDVLAPMASQTRISEPHGLILGGLMLLGMLGRRHSVKS